jgi:alginate O-acetyltransferase complex protein AlgI
MWIVAFAAFALSKWLTWRRASRRWAAAPGVSAGYLFGWVGMDAEPFLKGTRPPSAPSREDWSAAAIKTLIGAALVIAAGRLASVHDALAAGWLGMVGMILLLHFGSFQLLALAWRVRQIDVQPLMNRPFGASSLREFWGERWNAAFHALARDLIFWPLARRHGGKMAALGVFLFSGLIHDAVISLPAGGGYGLPTAYFTLQGAATLFERSVRGRRLGLGQGWRGRVFTLVIAGAPAFWLFHPPFVRNVVLPMLRAIDHAVAF